ncbi:MAG: hypothetical protein ACPIOQ_20330 [Promethearchaeia archaeon]
MERKGIPEKLYPGWHGSAGACLAGSFGAADRHLVIPEEVPSSCSSLQIESLRLAAACLPQRRWGSRAPAARMDR